MPQTTPAEQSPFVLKIDAKNGITVRLNTYKDRTKVYIQGGYEPNEAYIASGSELMMEPTEEFPSGLAFGKAVTLQAQQLPALVRMLQRFMLSTPYLHLVEAQKKANATQPTTAATAPKPTPKPAKAKGKTLGTNRIEPQPTAEAEKGEGDEF